MSEDHHQRHPQQTRFEAKLTREYKSLAREMMDLEKPSLRKQYSPEQIRRQMLDKYERQSQIVKELEHCTGKIIAKTEEEILEENRRIQAQGNADEARRYEAQRKRLEGQGQDEEADKK